jgi:hypothetical protein
MDTTALRAGYARLFDVANSPEFGEAADGGRNAEQLLAHVLSVNSGIAAAASLHSFMPIRR